jgi:sigma-B regulation protein RsbU (phosphoserine phosphatase)
MDTKFFTEIRDSLFLKQQILSQWLKSASSEEKRVALGPAREHAIQDHLETIDQSIDKADDQTLGLCTVCHDYVQPELIQMDYTSCVCLDHLSEQERRTLEYELELSQSFQKALMPQQVPSIAGVELAAFSRPAQIVGGDYFDFPLFSTGDYGLAIGDVAGKGMSASLPMASLQSALNSIAPISESPAEVMERINRLFTHNVHITTFITLFLASYNPATQVLTYCSAGHNPPLLLKNSGQTNNEAVWLDPTGAAIGLIEDAKFFEKSLLLSPGDVILLYTDGVTEATDAREEQFGIQRLAELVRQVAKSPVQDLIATLRRALSDFTEGKPLPDDTTVVAWKISA